MGLHFGLEHYFLNVRMKGSPLYIRSSQNLYFTFSLCSFLPSFIAHSHFFIFFSFISFYTVVILKWIESNVALQHAHTLWKGCVFIVKCCNMNSAFYFSIHFHVTCGNGFLQKLFQPTVTIKHIFTHQGTYTGTYGLFPGILNTDKCNIQIKIRL